MNTFAATITRPKTRGVLGQGLWLASGPALACLYVWLLRSGLIRFGLGWSVQPGWLLLLGIGVLAALDFRAGRSREAVRVVVCLLAALFLEWYFPTGPWYPFVGIGLTLLALSGRYESGQSVRIVDLGFLLLAAYIQSVFIYNMFCGMASMGFFRAGWTA